jgi:putative SOS response-associated peptidase YedK
MCFHYSLTKERTAIELLLHADWDDEGWQPVYHADGFTFPRMPVITQEEPGQIRLMHWGLIPHWVKSKAAADDLRAKTLNARSETLFEKPSFRGYIMSQRCGVIADGFFEWMDFQKKKYPHYIFLEGQPLFCFAGIYSHWTDRDTGEHLSTFSVITTEANPMMARIHNLKQRMPVILSPDQCRKWLDPGLSKEEVMDLLRPYPEATMRSRTISRLITSRTHDSNVPEVLEKQLYPELGGIP